MGVFLYYLPFVARDQVTLELLQDSGLGVTFRDLSSPAELDRSLILHAVLAKGPDGSAGTIVVCKPVDGSDLPQAIGYFPAQQTWQDCGRFWLGQDQAHPPTPDQLRRPSLVGGYQFELGDGLAWECPVIRAGGFHSRLPQHWGLSADGKFTERTVDEYDWAWQMSGEIFDVCFGFRSIERDEAWDYCVRCLSLNYRLGPREVSALGLLRSDNYQQVFQAAIDGTKLEELFTGPQGAELLEQMFGDGKKKDSEPPPDPNSGPGPPAGIPDTGPVAATST